MPKGKSNGNAVAKPTVAQIIGMRQEELLADWLQIMRSEPGTRILDLLTEEQLLSETTDLLRTLTKSFASEQYFYIDTPEYADSVAMLRDISASRAALGFTPFETAGIHFVSQGCLVEIPAGGIGRPPEIAQRRGRQNECVDR